MSFAVPFSTHFEYFQDDNLQLNIVYKPKVKQLDTFLEKYGSYRINFLMPNFISNNDISIITALKEKYPDTQIVLGFPKYDKELEEELCEKEFPHYYTELIATWDRFKGFLSLNVTDIFVAGELCFFAKDLRVCARETGIKLRCYCNVCQSSWDETPSLKTFFIRPEDFQLYERYFDTFEFYVDRKDVNRLNVLYRVYTRERRWMGRLDEIIVGYDGDEESAFIMPSFGERRLNCGKRCNKKVSGGCRLCENLTDIGIMLKDNGLYVRINGYNEEIEDEDEDEFDLNLEEDEDIDIDDDEEEEE